VGDEALQALLPRERNEGGDGMSEHTPEPWRTQENPMWLAEAGGGGNDTWPLHWGDEDPEGDEDPLIGMVFEEANARRIVAAVNACAGIPIENLEALPERSPTILRATVKAMTRVRTPEEEAQEERDMEEVLAEEERRDAAVSRLAEALAMLEDFAAADRPSSIADTEPEWAEGFDFTQGAVRAFLETPGSTREKGE